MSNRVAQTLALIAVLALGITARSHAHLGDSIAPVQVAVTTWAAAIQGDDIEGAAAVLSDGLTSPTGSKSAYLATLPLAPVSKVVLRYADYQISDHRAVVSPVVVYLYREMKLPSALTLTLDTEGEAWRIVSITPAPSLPEELLERNHPLQQILHDVQVSVRDGATGAPIHARIHVRDSAGEYWPSQGHRKSIAKGWREDIGGDVIVAGKTFAYVQPDFMVQLPAGRYVLEAERGLEYAPQRIELEVAPGNIPAPQVTLRRWVHMAQQGWYSGDSHTHFLDPHSALLEAQGEDLNVINVLASSGGNLITSVNHFTGAPSVLSGEENIVYISEETRHDYLGHAVLLNLKSLISPFGWGPPLTGMHGAYDYPPMAHQADEAHAQGALVIWAHLPHPYAELPIDVALDKIDAVEAMVFGSPFEQHPARIELGSLTPQPLSPLQLWYSLLNTGSDLPALGATDKMWNSQVPGAVRTYVRLEGKLTYQAWIDGIKAGRTFLTTGPMIDLAVGGKAIGESLSLARRGKVPFVARVQSRLPIDRIEVVVNGQVVASRDNTGQGAQMQLSGEAQITASSWIAARAYSAMRLPVQEQLTGGGAQVFAHTSPIYVAMAGKPRRSRADAAFLAAIADQTIQWAKTKARYHNEGQRREVLALYERARDVYARQAAGD
jgi:hypothetical protein